MTGYLARRLLSSLLLLLLVASLTFFLLHLVPGDPLNSLTGDRSLPPEQRARLESLYGLDRPLAEQYLAWLGAAARWDWGTSITRQRPVTTIIGEALPATVLLALGAMAVEYAVALPLGLWAARRRGRAVDHAVRAGTLVTFALPTFWTGLMAIFVFSYLWPLFPASHAASPGADALPLLARLADRLHHLALPALVLGLTMAAGTTRFVRNSLLEVLSLDHVRTARAKGLGEGTVLLVHGLRNALPPILQLIGLSLPSLLNGVLVIEVVFSWPGLGLTTVQAIRSLDYPVILAVTTFAGALVVLGNLAADLLHAAVDPRVREAIT